MRKQTLTLALAVLAAAALAYSVGRAHQFRADQSALDKCNAYLDSFEENEFGFYAERCRVLDAPAYPL